MHNRKLLSFLPVCVGPELRWVISWSDIKCSWLETASWGFAAGCGLCWCLSSNNTLGFYFLWFCSAVLSSTLCFTAGYFHYNIMKLRDLAQTLVWSCCTKYSAQTRRCKPLLQCEESHAFTEPKCLHWVCACGINRKRFKKLFHYQCERKKNNNHRLNGPTVLPPVWAPHFYCSLSLNFPEPGALPAAGPTSGFHQATLVRCVSSFSISDAPLIFHVLFYSFSSWPIFIFLFLTSQYAFTFIIKVEKHF